MHRPGAVPRPASPRDEGVRTRNASRLEENALKRPRAAREQSPPRYRPRPPPAPPRPPLQCHLEVQCIAQGQHPGPPPTRVTAYRPGTLAD